MLIMVDHAVHIAAYVVMVLQVVVTSAKMSKMANTGIFTPKEVNYYQRKPIPTDT